MYKLINILNELDINNPNKTVEEVYDYYDKNISGGKDSIFQIYKELCGSWVRRYNIDRYVHFIDEFRKLSQKDLNRLYRLMKQLVQKYS